MINEKIVRSVVTLCTDPKAIIAKLTWPVFSFASYSIMSSLYRQGLRPATIIDVGANIGQFAVASAKIFPDAAIHAIEPQPDCFKDLRDNTKDLRNISAHANAVGDTECDVEMRINSHRHSSSLLDLGDAHIHAFPGATEQAVISVSMTTLDHLFSDVVIKRPCLLKLDIQGYEPQALRGARSLLEAVDNILIELSFKPMYQGEKLFNEMLALLSELDFSFDRPVDWLTNPSTGEVLQMDALFVRKRH